MGCQTTEKTETPFPSIEQAFLDRLADEADQRTLQPQAIDWQAVHREAKRVREATDVSAA